MVARVVASAVFMGVLGGVWCLRPWGSERKEGERTIHSPKDSPPRGYYTTDPSKHLHEPFEYQDFPRYAKTGFHETKGTKDDPFNGLKSKYDPKAVYFIPVKFDFNEGSLSERSLVQDKSYDTDSPRLIMDKDFNIRFDNPYIVPLTKPLALVLDRNLGRSSKSGPSGEKMMIPFPVLVKARKPLLDSEGFRDYRDEDEVAEHRSGDFEDGPEIDPPVKSIRREVARPVKKWKNETASVPKKKYVEKKTSLYSLEEERTKKPARYKAPRYQHENVKNYTTQDPLDIYPGKIFAEMYRSMPTFRATESTESQEIEPPRYSSPPVRNTPQVSSEVTNSHWRPRASKFPGSEHLFAAASDFEWVTHANSTKAKKVSSASEEKETRIVIQDVEDNDTSSLETTTIRPEEATLSERFWRTV